MLTQRQTAGYPSGMAAMTNAQIGEMIGLSFTAVSRMRNGDRLPSVEVMTKISTVFEIPLEDVVRATRAGDTTLLRRESWGRYFSGLVEAYERKQADQAHAETVGAVRTA